MGSLWSGLTTFNLTCLLRGHDDWLDYAAMLDEKPVVRVRCARCGRASQGAMDGADLTRAHRRTQDGDDRHRLGKVEVMRTRVANILRRRR